MVKMNGTVWDITWMSDQSVHLPEDMPALEQVTVKFTIFSNNTYHPHSRNRENSRWKVATIWRSLDGISNSSFKKLLGKDTENRNTVSWIWVLYKWHILTLGQVIAWTGWWRSLVHTSKSYHYQTNTMSWFGCWQKLNAQSVAVREDCTCVTQLMHGT